MSEDEVVEFFVEGNMVSDNHPSEFYSPSISTFLILGDVELREAIPDPTLEIVVSLCTLEGSWCFPF